MKVIILSLKTYNEIVGLILWILSFIVTVLILSIIVNTLPELYEPVMAVIISEIWVLAFFESALYNKRSGDDD